MKKFSVVTLLVIVCLGMMAIIIASFVGTYYGGLTLGEYKGLTPQTQVSEITDEQVEYALQQSLYSMATQQEATKDAEFGDTIMVTYEGKINGVKDEVFCDTNREIVLGQGQFVVEDVEQELVGADVGVPMTIAMTIPETHHAAEYIGQRVEFTITVTSILRNVPPELTDELVKTLGDYTSVEDYKTKFAQNYREQATEEMKAQYRSELFSLAVDNAIVKKYPQKEIEQNVAYWVEQMEAAAEDFGMPYEDYLSLNGLTVASASERALTYAQGVAKQNMVINALAKKEKITLSPEQYEAHYKEYLDVFTAEGFSEEYMVEYYGGEEGLTQQFLMEEVTNRLEEYAAK